MTATARDCQRSHIPVHRVPVHQVLPWFVSIAVCTLGCSRGPARIYPPKVNAAQAAADAVEELDQDDDGLLAPEELKQCPGIYAARAAYDEDDDGHVSAQEIETRIAQLSRDGMTGMYSLACRFMLDGAPLAGATIELIPEKFLGDAVKNARGTTSSRGLVRPITQGVGDAPLHGTQPGIFRIAVTGPTEAVTARYGDGELLGLEVSESCLGTNIVFQLTSQ